MSQFFTDLEERNTVNDRMIDAYDEALKSLRDAPNASLVTYARTEAGDVVIIADLRNKKEFVCWFVGHDASRYWGFYAPYREGFGHDRKQAWMEAKRVFDERVTR